MATIRELIIKITSKGGARAATDLAKAKKGAENLGKEAAKSEDKVKNKLAAITKYARMTQKSFKSLANGTKMMAMGMGMVIGAQGFLLAQTSLYGEEVKRFSQGFGATIEQAQEYREAFKVLGGTTDDLADALGTVVDRGKDALEGSKTYQKEFKRLKITMTELKDAMKKGAIDVFDLYVKKSVQVKDKTEAITAAVRLFGDDLGRRLLPVLTSGEEAFAKIIKMSKTFGLILKKDEIDNLAKLRTEFRQFEFFVLGMARRLSAKLATAILPISDDLQGWLFRIEKIINAGFDGWVKMMGEEIEKLAQYAKEFYDMLGGDAALKSFMETVTELTPLLLTLGAGFTLILGSGVIVALFSKMTAAGLALYAVFGLLIAVAADVWGYFQGVDSILGDLAKRFPDVERQLASIKASFSDLKWAVNGAWQVFKHLFKTLNEEGVDGATGVETVLISIVKALGTIIKAFALLLTVFVLAAAGVAGILDVFVQIDRKIDEIIDKVVHGLGGAVEKVVDKLFGKGASKKALSVGVDTVEGIGNAPVVGAALGAASRLPIANGLRGVYNSAKRGDDANRLASKRAAQQQGTQISANAATRMDPLLDPIGLMSANTTLPPSQRMPGMSGDFGMPNITVQVMGTTDKQNAVEIGKKAGQGAAGALRQAKAANQGGAK